MWTYHCDLKRSLAWISQDGKTVCILKVKYYKPSLM